MGDLTDRMNAKMDYDLEHYPSPGGAASPKPVARGMGDDATTHARAALDQAATAIQALGNAFDGRRSTHTAKNDLARAREHLSAASRATNS